jgi:hypothetical protein
LYFFYRANGRRVDAAVEFPFQLNNKPTEEPPMTIAKLKLPLEVYKKFRNERSSRVSANQIQALANRVLNRSKRGSGQRSPAATDATFLFLNRPLGISSQNVFFDNGPPYTSGSPNPEYTERTGGTAESPYYFNIEALGNPANGHLSVGISAGTIRGADWTGGTYYSNLPGRWMWGDMIQGSASILQVVDLPTGLKPGTPLSANVALSWEITFPAIYVITDPNWYKQLYRDALRTVPGSSNSPMGGFVGVTAVVNLDVSIISDTAVLATSQDSQQILGLGVDAQNYGDAVQDKAPADYLWFDFAFADNHPWTVINLLGSLGFVEGAKQMLVEITVRLVGARGGVADPNAGWVTAAFLDIGNGASPVADIPGRPNPFVVNRITTFFTT